MLSTLVALQLVLLAQVGPPPREVTPDERPDAEEGAPAAQSAPLPSRGAPTPDARGAAPARPRLPSLLSAETLGDAAAAFGWAGWSSLGAAYGQGITARDDLVAFLDLDWSTTELRAGALYRRPLGQAGVFDMAARLSVAWYENFGGDAIHEENHSDRGVELVPGLSFSRRASGGVFSMIGEAPLTVTTKHGSGLIFAPRLSIAYEAPLFTELTLGARLGAGYRAGSGDAPLADGQAQLLFLVVATWRLL